MIYVYTIYIYILFSLEEHPSKTILVIACLFVSGGKKIIFLVSSGKIFTLNYANTVTIFPRNDVSISAKLIRLTWIGYN